MKTRIKTILRGLLIILAVGSMMMLIPAIRDRVFWRIDQLRIYLRYTLFPPEEAVFIPNETPFRPPTIVPSQTQKANEDEPTRANPTATMTLPAQKTALPSITQTPTSTAMPTKIILEGVKYEDQHGLWNYCAPANLAMALSYWGWEGDRLKTGAYLKPEEDDKNVMPYEMVDYVLTQTNLGAVVRSGGTIDIIKKLIANGYPVLIEKGVINRETLSGRMTWMGHYALLIGYDDVENIFISRDSYFSPPDYPLDFPIPYDEIINQWRGFNYIFIVIYPVNKQNEVIDILGDYADEEYAFRAALARADEEILTQNGLNKFFALFNRGTSLVRLFDYGAAAEAYDQAFELYAELPKEDRPYRMMWYQTGPYFAYYYTNRFQDVIDLASTTISAADKPFLEESWYWRGVAKLAIGDTNGGIEDLRASLKYHPGFEPSLEKLKQLGITN